MLPEELVLAASAKLIRSAITEYPDSDFETAEEEAFQFGFASALVHLADLLGLDPKRIFLMAGVGSEEDAAKLVKFILEDADGEDSLP